MIDFEGFGKALMKKYWEYDCGQIEGDEIQDIALEYGLIAKVSYDPEKHGEGGLDFGLEKGDEWYVPAWKEEERCATRNDIIAKSCLCSDSLCDNCNEVKKLIVVMKEGK